MRGRKPSPERLTLLAKPRGHALGSLEPPPEAPDWLDADARDEWDRVVPALARVYLFVGTDIQLLAAYCQSYATWKRMTIRMRAEGEFIETPSGLRSHPALKECARLMTEMRRLAAEFGFTPAARSRITVDPPTGKDEDDFEAFTKGGL